MTTNTYRDAALGTLLLAIAVTVLLSDWLCPTCLIVRTFDFYLSSPFRSLLVCLLVGLGGPLLWHGINPSSLQRTVRWAAAWDLDYPSTGASKDGTGVFIALASFALAEGGALTAVAKGEERDSIVLTIYAIVVLFTIWWVVRMLRSTSTAELAGQPQTYRTFDEASMRYGRMSLLWTCVLALIMVFLAVNQLLPNQTHRVAYSNKDVVVNTDLMGAKKNDILSFMGGDLNYRTDLSVWLKWIIEGEEWEHDKDKKDAVIKSRLLWIEKSSPFNEYYKSFVAKLNFDATKFKVEDRAAFLVSRRSFGQTPTYRQLLFRRENDAWGDHFDVVDPNPGDVLVVIARISNLDNKAITDQVAQYQVAITLDK